MERVETLLQKLQHQVKEKHPADQLLLTVQMLQHELVHSAGAPASVTQAGPVVVSMPTQAIPEIQAAAIAPVLPVAAAKQVEKTVEVLQVDEEDVEAELEAIKRNAGARQQLATHNKPRLLFDEVEDEVPTLAQHDLSGMRGREINEAATVDIGSLNDRLKEVKIEISEKLNEQPVKDLRKAIGINDRFLYINDLFRGDEAMYERSIKTINGFSIWPEAEYWIRRELKTKLGWTEENATVKQFDQLVRRRFS